MFGVTAPAISGNASRSDDKDSKSGLKLFLASYLVSKIFLVLVNSVSDRMSEFGPQNRWCL